MPTALPESCTISCDQARLCSKMPTDHMKLIASAVITNAVGLYTLTLLISSIQIIGGVKTYVLAAVALGLLNTVVKPLINLFLLPVNILTLGLFRWVTSAVILWLLTVVVPPVHVAPYHFSGFTYQGVVLPPLKLTLFWTLVVGAFILSTATALLDWATKK